MNAEFVGHEDMNIQENSFRPGFGTVIIWDLCELGEWEGLVFLACMNSLVDVEASCHEMILKASFRSCLMVCVKQELTLQSTTTSSAL